MYEFPSTHPCVNCGITDIAVLTSHHADPNFKKHNVSKKVYHGYAIQTIQRELDRCIVLCRNCHMKLEEREKAKGKKL